MFLERHKTLRIGEKTSPKKTPSSYVRKSHEGVKKFLGVRNFFPFFLIFNCLDGRDGRRRDPRTPPTPTHERGTQEVPVQDVPAGRKTIF